jgi:hypothetical protein
MILSKICGVKMPKKKRNLNQPSLPRMPQELKIVAHHLKYEKAMLEFTGERLLRHPSPVNLDYAVLMESFLIHARNLNEFFYGWEMAANGQKMLLQDDVIAEDFFDAKKRWLKPQTNRLSDELRQRINDQLSHLTYARVVGRYGDWDFSDIRQRMSNLVDLFFQEVSPDKVGN